ncbi:MAG: hypothetical protein H6713_19085 [Myxococcales bacterium]|nr:hypothetical protein [Myxococcales bacterium]
MSEGCTRRRWLAATLGASAAVMLWRPRAGAAPASGGAPASRFDGFPDKTARRLRNRVELWRGYAARTQSLRARYTLTRRTSLLVDPLVVTGTLVFVAPATLVLRDDAHVGSTTRVVGDAVTITPNDSSAAARGRESPALAWLRARMLTLFAPPPGDNDPELAARALLEGCDVSIPKGAGMQLLLQPRAGADAITRALRSLRVRLDTMTGAVSALELEETLGDRVLLELGQQQQNLDEDVLRQLIDR